MPRHISVNNLDRLYASLPYLLPMTVAVFFGAFLFAQFPPIAIVFSPFAILALFLSISVEGISIRLITWFCTFFFVVRNYKVSRFIRFNAMQALMLDILISLIVELAKLLGILTQPFLISLKNEILLFILPIISGVIFLGITWAFFYAVFQCVRGNYPDKIPVISNVTNYHVH